MKIIIVGAGVGGLTAYRALKKELSSVTFPEPLTIKIVDQAEGPGSGNVGLALNIPPNGLRALAAIAPRVCEDITKSGFPASKKTFCNGDGSILGVFSFGTEDRYGYETHIIAKGDLIDALLPLDSSVSWSTRVTGVIELPTGVQVVYSDGQTEIADLVIGADGTHSVVRTSVTKLPTQASYDGINTVGGYIPLSDVSPHLGQALSSHEEVITFGRKGAFGFSMCSPSSTDTEKLSPEAATMQWWAVYENAEPLPTSGFDMTPVKSHLLSLHSDWVSPGGQVGDEKAAVSVYKEIIELGCSPSSATFASPRFHIPRLSYWTNASPLSPVAKGRIVLLGNAAHSTVREIGQTTASAIEDAYTYAMLFKHFMTATAVQESVEGSSFVKAANAYQDLRIARVGKILDCDKGTGCMKKEFGWFAQMLRDFALKMLCRAPQHMHDVFFKYDCEADVRNYLDNPCTASGKRCRRT